MNLSVVVPTLNGRDQLAAGLDALAAHAPDAEVVVVNGPSTDGTTGMIQDRGDVDVLVELADRTINAARNAGIDSAGGDAIAFVNHTLAITSEWYAAVTDGLADTDVVTGPTRSELDADSGLDHVERRTIAGREVTYFNPGNVAFRTRPLDDLDGFDEYLEIGGARDFAHRLAANDFAVSWADSMAVVQELSADGGERASPWDWKYRSLAYRLVKNYGLRPTVIRRLVSHATADSYSELRAVLDGENRPSAWFGSGNTVVQNTLVGCKDGLTARRFDRTSRRNPRGRSARSDRAVSVYDWR